MENRAVCVLNACFMVWWRPVSSSASLTVFWCLHLDRQLVRLHLDSDDVLADEVAVFAFCGIPEMLADGACDENLDLGRRQAAHRSDTPRLSVQEG
jgi:hypothetical protein